jgi:beta-glucosidase
MARRFPSDFTWGVATAAHQVEGGNWNSDWWAWEHAPGSPCIEPSGDACDQWHRWPDDVALLADLGFGAYRFSVEWARIEPEEGETSAATLEHYRRVCLACRERGVEPIVTLHHFTTPRWVAAGGGWTAAATVERFARYAARTARALADVAGRFCTINEPNIVATMGYAYGLFPPGEHDLDRRRRANEVLVAAHRAAVAAVRDAGVARPIGLTLAMADYQAVGGPDAVAMRDAYRRDMEDVYLEAVGDDDFVGVQCYTRTRFDAGGMLGPEDGVPVTDLGYEVWPDALAGALRRAAALTDVPLLVTENGLSTDDDEARIAYVARALAGVHACLADGVDVRGYLYWSLLDNFEWIFGYRPRFGLVGVDRATQARTPKRSARWLGEVARRGCLPG